MGEQDRQAILRAEVPLTGGVQAVPAQLEAQRQLDILKALLRQGEEPSGRLDLTGGLTATTVFPGQEITLEIPQPEPEPEPEPEEEEEPEPEPEPEPELTFEPPPVEDIIGPGAEAAPPEPPTQFPPTFEPEPVEDVVGPEPEPGLEPGPGPIGTPGGEVFPPVFIPGEEGNIRTIFDIFKGLGDGEDVDDVLDQEIADLENAILTGAISDAEFQHRMRLLFQRTLARSLGQLGGSPRPEIDIDVILDQLGGVPPGTGLEDPFRSFGIPFPGDPGLGGVGGFATPRRERTPFEQEVKGG